MWVLPFAMYGNTTNPKSVTCFYKKQWSKFEGGRQIGAMKNVVYACLYVSFRIFQGAIIFLFLNSDGLIFSSFLKTFEKWACSLKPTA